MPNQQLKPGEADYEKLKATTALLISEGTLTGTENPFPSKTVYERSGLPINPPNADGYKAAALRAAITQRILPELVTPRGEPEQQEQEADGDAMGRTSATPRGDRKPAANATPSAAAATPTSTARNTQASPNEDASTNWSVDSNSTMMPKKITEFLREEWDIYTDERGWKLMRLFYHPVEGCDPEDVKWTIETDNSGANRILRMTWTRPKISFWFQAKGLFRIFFELNDDQEPPITSAMNSRFNSIQNKKKDRPKDFFVEVEEWLLPCEVERILHSPLQDYGIGENDIYVIDENTNEGYFLVTMVVDRGTFQEMETRKKKTFGRRWRDDNSSYFGGGDGGNNGNNCNGNGAAFVHPQNSTASMSDA
jgi:hypothetical protein